MPVTIKSALKNIKDIYMSDTSLATLLSFERVIDELDVYVFKNWRLGELVEGPIYEKYFITATFMWPYEDMPEPRGGEQLLRHNCSVTYKKDLMEMPVHVESEADFKPGTKMPKNKKVPVWLVTISMPKKLIVDIEDGVYSESSNDIENSHGQEIDNDSYKLGESVITESKFGDLKRLVTPILTVDVYTSEVGADRNVIVLGIPVLEKEAAVDIAEFAEKSYDWVLDADASDVVNSENGEFMVFIELSRNPSAPENIYSFVSDLLNLTDQKMVDWNFVYYKSKQKLPLSIDNLRDTIILSPERYAQLTKKPHRAIDTEQKKHITNTAKIGQRGK